MKGVAWALGIMLVAVASAPYATADISVDTAPARIVVGTGHSENCLPSEAACAFAHEPGDEARDHTLFLNSNASFRADVHPSRALPADLATELPSAAVSVDEVSAEAPLLPLVLNAWDTLTPDDPLFHDYLELHERGATLHYPWVSGLINETGPDPYLNWKSYTAGWTVLNASHVFVPFPRIVIYSTTDFFMDRTTTTACENDLLNPMNATVGCVTRAPTQEARRVWNGTMPNVVFGLRVDGVNATVGNASNTTVTGAVGGAAAPTSLGSALPGSPMLSLAPEPVPHGALVAPEAPPPVVWEAPRENAPHALTSVVSQVSHAPAANLTTAAAAAATAIALLALAAWALIYRGKVRGQGPAALLKSKVRRRILAAAREEPGLTGADIAERVGVSHNAVTYHLRLMADAKLVSIVRNGGPRSYQHVYPAKEAPRGPARDAALCLQSPAACEVAGELLAAGDVGVTTATMEARTGLPITTIRYHFQRLERAHLVIAEEAGARLVYRVPPQLRDALGLALASVGQGRAAREQDGRASGLEVKRPASAAEQAATASSVTRTHISS